MSRTSPKWTDSAERPSAAPKTREGEQGEHERELERGRTGADARRARGRTRSRREAPGSASRKCDRRAPTAAAGNTSGETVVLRSSGPFARNVSTASSSDDDANPHTSTPPKRKSAYGLHVRPRREDEPEDGRVDEQQEQRVQERPEEAERAPAVARGELAAHEGRRPGRDAPRCGEVGREDSRLGPSFAI